MSDEIKLKLSPYLGCSKRLIEAFAIIGYEEGAIKSCFPYLSTNQWQLELTFLSIVTSDLSNEIALDYIIKQVYPDKPQIIKSGKHPKPSNVIFFSCIDSIDDPEKKIFNSCYALRFYEKIEMKTGEKYYVPKAFLIYSQYPYFYTFYRICDKILNYNNISNERDIPIEIFIHCLVNYFPSPINNNLLLKDFTPHIIIPKLTGYPYIDFNLGKILCTLNLVDFIKIYILIFLELDLLFFSPYIEKLNIFMFALYILNYPLTDSLYFWHIKTISIDDLKLGDDTITTSFKGVNSDINKNLDLTEFKTLNFVVDLENKKQPIISLSDNEESTEINLLLKYINNVLSRGLNFKKSFFLEEYLIKLYKKLKNIIKEYNEIAQNDANIAESYFYVNKSVGKINLEIQEAFYDFVLNMIVELNKDFILDPKLEYPITKKQNLDNPKLLEEEKIFLEYSRRTIKYQTYFEIFLKEFKAYDGLKVSLLFSDEFVNIKKQGLKKIEESIKYFEIVDNLYVLKKDDIVFDLNGLYREYNKKVYNPSKNAKKKIKLFNLDKDTLKKFVYKKKNKGEYTILKDPEDIYIETTDLFSLTMTLQYFLSRKSLIKAEYYTRGSAAYLISLCIPFFSETEIPFVIFEYLQSLKKLNFFNRYYIFILLKSINKYYKLNKEKGSFPEMRFSNVQKYYGKIQQYLNENSIIQDEQIFTFFKKYYGINEEEENKENRNIIDNNSFIFKYDEDYDKNINKNLAIKEDEIVYLRENNTLKYKKIDIPAIFQELYSYYEFYMSKDEYMEQFDANKLLEKAVNLVFYFMKLKDDKIIDILYQLICSLLTYQEKIKK